MYLHNVVAMRAHSADEHCTSDIVVVFENSLRFVKYISRYVRLVARLRRKNPSFASVRITDFSLYAFESVRVDEVAERIDESNDSAISMSMLNVDSPSEFRVSSSWLDIDDTGFSWGFFEKYGGELNTAGLDVDELRALLSPSHVLAERHVAKVKAGELCPSSR